MKLFRTHLLMLCTAVMLFWPSASRANPPTQSQVVAASQNATSVDLYYLIDCVGKGISDVIAYIFFNPNITNKYEQIPLDKLKVDIELQKIMLNKTIRDYSKHYNISKETLELLRDQFYGLHNDVNYSLKIPKSAKGQKDVMEGILKDALAHYQSTHGATLQQWNDQLKHEHETLKNNPQMQPFFTNKYLHAFKGGIITAGYAAACVLGAYTGNRIYEAFLADYFTNDSTWRDALMEKFIKIREKCASLKERLQQKRKVLDGDDGQQPGERNQAKLRVTIYKLEKLLATSQKQARETERQMKRAAHPGTIKRLAGLTTKIAIITATTYLSYHLYRAADERYFSSGIQSPEVEAALIDRWKKLENHKEEFETIEGNLRKFHNLNKELESQEPLTDGLFHLWSIVKNITSSEDYLRASTMQGPLGKIGTVLSPLHQQ